MSILNAELHFRLFVITVTSLQLDVEKLNHPNITPKKEGNDQKMIKQTKLESIHFMLVGK